MSPASIDTLSTALSVQKLKDDATNWLTYQTCLETAVASKGLLHHLSGQVRIPRELPIQLQLGTHVTLVKGEDPDDLHAQLALEAQIEENEKSIDEYAQQEAMYGKTIDFQLNQ